jgi:hypothetical protein
MKKIMLIAFAALFGSVAFGQLGFGIKGAVSMSKLSPNISDYKDAAQTGFQVGAFFRIGDKLHLQPEAYFSAKKGQLTYSGYDVNDPLKTGEVTQDITFNTLDIPVLIGYKIFDPPAMNIRLQAGPVASMVLNKKFEVSSSDGITPPEPDNAYQDAFKNLNWGLQVGGGVDFLFLTADIRYEIGLSNLFKAPDSYPDSAPSSFKNNLFFISLGWKIL